jgi:hypothetical protein
MSTFVKLASEAPLRRATAEKKKSAHAGSEAP